MACYEHACNPSTQDCEEGRSEFKASVHNSKTVFKRGGSVVRKKQWQIQIIQGAIINFI